MSWAVTWRLPSTRSREISAFLSTTNAQNGLLKIRKRIPKKVRKWLIRKTKRVIGALKVNLLGFYSSSKQKSAECQLLAKNYEVIEQIGKDNEVDVKSTFENFNQLDEIVTQNLKSQEDEIKKKIHERSRRSIMVNMSRTEESFSKRLSMLGNSAGKLFVKNHDQSLSPSQTTTFDDSEHILPKKVL